MHLKSFSELDDVICDQAQQPRVGLEPHWGGSGASVVHTHEGNVRRLGLPKEMALTHLVAVDRRRRSVAYRGRFTVLGDERVESLRVAGFRGEVRRLRYRCLPASPVQLADHELTVFFIEADSRAVSWAMARQGFVPDVLISISDGCTTYGGKRGCWVNGLRGRPVPPRRKGYWEWRDAGWHYMSAVESVVPPLWITDHFRYARGVVQDGDLVVRSRDPQFPFQFRRVQKVSPSWGRPYGQRYGLGSATLFRTELAGASPDLR